MARAGWAGAALLAAALSGCGQQAPQDLSYVLVELDAVKGAKGAPTDALVTFQSKVEPSTQLCVRLASVGSAAPASFVLFRKFGADPAPLVTLTVKSFAGLENNGVPDGSQFGCPGGPPSPLTTQTVMFDFCAAQSVKLQVEVGSTCAGCDPTTEVCGAGLSPDGEPCAPGECCASPVSDACALVPAPTTTTPAPP